MTGAPTERELEVLALLALPGSTARSVARELGLAEPTVKGHLARLYRKLGVNSAIQAFAALSETVRKD